MMVYLDYNATNRVSCGSILGIRTIRCENSGEVSLILVMQALRNNKLEK